MNFEETLPEPDVDIPQILAGLTLVVTGGIEGWGSRDDVKTAVVARGGTFATSVSGKTSFVVRGASPGKSKIDKAEKLNTPIIEAEDFAPLLAASTLEAATSNLSESQLAELSNRLDELLAR